VNSPRCFCFSGLLFDIDRGRAKKISKVLWSQFEGDGSSVCSSLEA
jgi:hypothetical protein